MKYLGPVGSVGAGDVPEGYRDDVDKESLGTTGSKSIEPVDTELPEIKKNPRGVDNEKEFRLQKKGNDFQVNVEYIYEEGHGKIGSGRIEPNITVEHEGETYYVDSYDENKNALIFSKYGDKPRINGKEIGGLRIENKDKRGKIVNAKRNMESYVENKKEKIKDAPLLFEVDNKEWRMGSEKVFEVKGIPDKKQREVRNFIEKFQGKKSIKGTGINNIKAENLGLKEGETYTGQQIKALVQRKHEKEIAKEKETKEKLKSMKVKKTRKIDESSFEGTVSEIDYKGETYTVRVGGFDASYGEGPKEANWIPVSEVEEEVEDETESLLIKKASEK